jgi:hypothetical protein
LSKKGLSLRVKARAELRIANWDGIETCLEINNKLDAWNAFKKIIYRETRLLNFYTHLHTGSAVVNKSR